MKIAFVYDLVYPFTIGGGEKRNWEIASQLAQQGHDVWILGMQFWEGDAHLVKDKVNYLGVCPEHPVFGPSGQRSVMQPLLFAKGLFRHLGNHRYDVIDCSSFPYLSCLAVWLRYFPGPVPLTINWFEARGLRGWWNYQGWRGIPAAFFEYLCAQVTPFNTSISDLTIQQAKDRLGFKATRMELLSCGVDYEVYAKYHAIRKIPQILYAGRLVRHKRVDLLLEAFAALSATRPELKLKIIGSGDRLGDLQAMARNLDIQDKVEWVGRVGEEDLYSEFARSMVFVMPSEQEGFGLVIIEAMAAGTPVVALKCPDSAARFLIQHKVSGWLAENVPSMTEGVGSLMDDHALYGVIRENGITQAKSLDWKNAIVPQALAHYEKVKRTCG